MEQTIDQEPNRNELILYKTLHKNNKIAGNGFCENVCLRHTVHQKCLQKKQKCVECITNTYVHFILNILIYTLHTYVCTYMKSVKHSQSV